MRYITYHLVRLHQKFHVVRRMANGSWVGYDPVAHREDRQVHFAIRGSDRGSLIEACRDSRVYGGESEALDDLRLNGLDCASSRAVAAAS